jgi:hypothetical protein
MTEYEALQQKIKGLELKNKGLENENEMLKIDNAYLIRRDKELHSDPIHEYFNLYSIKREDFNEIFLKEKWNYNQKQIDAFWEYYDDVHTEDMGDETDNVIQQYIRHFNANYLDDYLEEQEEEDGEVKWDKEKAIKMIEDHDKLMEYPEIRKLIEEGEVKVSIIKKY